MLTGTLKNLKQETKKGHYRIETLKPLQLQWFWKTKLRYLAKEKLRGKIPGAFYCSRVHL